jgi:ankyrin repeat protein
MTGRNSLDLVLRKIGERTSYFDVEMNEVELVDVNQADWTGDSPLHIAAMYFDESVIALLVEAGAVVNAQGERNLTPLHVAYAKSNGDAIRTLLWLGADAHSVDDFGKKPSDWSTD